MKKYNYLIFLLVFLACSPAHKITVTNIHDLAAYPENSIIYSLPRSRLSIAVTAVKHHTIPGPYNRFAEKYLGIKGVPTISETEWELSKVNLGVFQEPDPDYYFSIQTNGMMLYSCHGNGQA